MLRYLLPLLCCLVFSTFTTAQTREDAARDDIRYGNQRSQRETFNEAGDIWYGAGAVLQFSSSRFSNQFRVGINPIVGYKFNNIISAGPRASIIYNAYGFETGTGGGRLKSRNWTWSIGAFTRAKIYRGFFVQAEYSLLSDVVITGVTANGQQLIEQRATRAVPFLGAGLSQGGGPGMGGFEILVMFRLTQPDRLNDSPYEFRTGFNYNF
ncbi:hypothetical protein LEM8419_00301 [Neolewinella maritima]|uniref:Outer membrane protein beta-barrel domain-containing protein n=1 Tax=Neolewinella maritima TaxID=1383882 RepID=A0ABN8F027_9BACT|nr:hypothetical protein [Neolewinella maritima]CAH0999008.1 hypothetical protein LEM8419_00301 [Neolewinella maritima]